MTQWKPRVENSLFRSCSSFKKSDSLLSLFTKGATRAIHSLLKVRLERVTLSERLIHSRRSLQKEQKELFALLKRAKGAIHSCRSLQK